MTISMGWPQWIMVALFILVLVTSINKHGKPRPPYDANATLIAVILEIAILYWGGFWS